MYPKILVPGVLLAARLLTTAEPDFRKKGEAWKDLFAGKNLKPRSHGLAQAEAVALSREDGRLIFALSEGRSAKMLILEETD